MKAYNLKLNLTLLIYILLVNLNYFKVEGQILDEECPSFACPKSICELKRKNAQNFCENVKCVGISVANCSVPDSTGFVIYEERLTMCGCCGGCVKYSGIGEPCEVHPVDPTPDPNCSDQFCPILMNRCLNGLICPVVGPNERKCSYKPNSGLSEMSSCHDKRALAYSGDLYWTPECDENGFYAPKQCKGSYSSGICFCVTKEGKRIFGTEYKKSSENQTCACSRQVHELRESGHIASFHCTPEGNYEPLQCDTESGLCYCVDPQTGKTSGAVLPENQWKSLPCFSPNLTNFNPDGGYYRVCESEWAPAQKIANEASLHGLRVLSGRRISCDFDGSFAPVQNIGEENSGITKCVHKDGRLMGGYRDTEDVREVNCQCVRDEVKANEEGVPFTKACIAPSGNYDWISPVSQTQPLKWRCVDADGIFFGDDQVEDAYKCCLIGDLDPTRLRSCDREPENVRQMCYDPNSPDNEGKIRPCNFWAT